MKIARRTRWRITLLAGALASIGIACYLVRPEDASDGGACPRQNPKTPPRRTVENAPLAGACVSDPAASLPVYDVPSPAATTSARTMPGLYGTVRWKSGGVIPFAVVEVVCDAFRVSSKCNSAGEYSLAVPRSGPATVMAYAGTGHLWTDTATSVTPGETRMDLEIRDEASLEIVVRDEEGRPLAAKIFLMCFSGSVWRPSAVQDKEGFINATCDTNGIASFEGLLPTEYDPPDPPPTIPRVTYVRKKAAGCMDYSVSCHFAGYRTQLVSWWALQPGPNKLEFIMKQMEAPITLRGVVLRPNGHPAPWAPVRWGYITPNSTSGGGQTGTVCGPDGSFLLALSGDSLLFEDSVKLIGNLVLYASMEDYAESSPLEVFDLKAGQVVENLQLTLEVGFLVSGRVVDRDGQPIADAEVGVCRMLDRGSQNELAGATTVADGTFRVRLPATGKCRFTAFKDDYEDAYDESFEVNASEATVEMPQDNVQLVLERKKEK